MTQTHESDKDRDANAGRMTPPWHYDDNGMYVTRSALLARPRWAEFDFAGPDAPAGDPGPVPGDTIASVNATVDAMALTTAERGELIDFLTGYDPRAVAAGLRSLQQRRQDRTSPTQRIVPDGFTASIFGQADE